MNPLKKLLRKLPGLHRQRQPIPRPASLAAAAAGFEFARNWPAIPEGRASESPSMAPNLAPNPLRTYFEKNKVGRGIWKWEHYFEIYHNHFREFVGRDVGVVEIGVYSGGSLRMWRNYFGSQSRIHGVDIEEACRVYEEEGVRLHIGDQSDRAFWRRFKQAVPLLDVVIDDGGHTAEQQTTTLEELLPHLRPGGVYLCEDIHRDHNQFAAYLSGYANHLNFQLPKPGVHLTSAVSNFQRAVYSIHLYPFVGVIQRCRQSPTEFVAPKNGSEWQPFL